MSVAPKESIYRSMKRLWKNYIRMCARRNVFWNLSIEQFQELTSKACFYCQKPPGQKSRSYTYNGIDRLEHRKGYEPPNCVPCCKECNFIKGAILSSAEMLVVARALLDYRKKKG